MNTKEDVRTAIEDLMNRGYTKDQAIAVQHVIEQRTTWQALNDVAICMESIKVDIETLTGWTLDGGR